MQQLRVGFSWKNYVEIWAGTFLALCPNEDFTAKINHRKSQRNKLLNAADIDRAKSLLKSCFINISLLLSALLSPLNDMKCSLLSSVISRFPFNMRQRLSHFVEMNWYKVLLSFQRRRSEGKLNLHNKGPWDESFQKQSEQYVITFLCDAENNEKSLLCDIRFIVASLQPRCYSTCQRFPHNQKSEKNNQRAFKNEFLMSQRKLG
jgi:hypothetical protein